jgi:hypothetical protein
MIFESLVPASQRPNTVSITKTRRLILFGEIIDAYSYYRTKLKHMRVKDRYYNIKVGGAYSNNTLSDQFLLQEFESYN